MRSTASASSSRNTSKPIRRRHDLCRAARADAGAAPALVPRLGAIGAQPISDFIAQHPAPQPVPGAPADVVPLEALRVPAALDGSAGLNRAQVPAHQVERNTDLQAVNARIAIRGARIEATRRAYWREAERLLLWAIVVKGKPLSSLNTMECAEYLDGFLRDPQPTERWIGRGRVERFDPAWRPFVGPLSERSRDTARRILNAMGAWLVGQQYLRVNPFGGLPAAPAVQLDTTGRTLTRAQWQYVLQTVLRPARRSRPSPRRTRRRTRAMRSCCCSRMRPVCAAPSSPRRPPALSRAPDSTARWTTRGACG